MNKLFYNKEKYIPIPSEWPELDKWQLATLVKHLHAQDDLQEHRLISLLILAATKDHLSHQAVIAGLSKEDRYDVCKQMTWWLYDKPIYFTHNPFVKYKGYYGPGTNFKYLYFEEFIQAEKYYQAFSKDFKVEDLNGIVSCIYRPKRWHFDRKNELNPDDVRVLYSKALQETMLEKVKLWPEELKLSIYFYFDSCLQMLVKTFPWAFEPGDKVKPRIKNDSAKTLYHVARELAKGIELEKVLFRPIIPVFFELNESRIDAEKLKLDMQKNPRK